MVLGMGGYQPKTNVDRNNPPRQDDVDYHLTALDIYNTVKWMEEKLDDIEDGLTNIPPLRNPYSKKLLEDERDRLYNKISDLKNKRIKLIE